MYFASQLSDIDRRFHGEVGAFLDENLDAATVAAEDAQRSMVASFARGNDWIERLRPRRWHAAHSYWTDVYRQRSDELSAVRGTGLF